MTKYDIAVIGMGPAGMAVTAMASSLGLKVVAIEKNKVGGECLNCGCIPSKGLLKSAQAKHISENLEKYGFKSDIRIDEVDVFQRVRDNVDKINDKKLLKSFEKAELLIGEEAAFLDNETLLVGERKVKYKKCFIATGTKPFIPPIEGIKDVPYLTNENIFELEKTPKSLSIIGGGAIGVEMAQAFSRLGCHVNIVQMDSYLVPRGDEEASKLLESSLIGEGIGVYNGVSIDSVKREGEMIILETSAGKISSEKLLVAAGRANTLESLNLKKAGIEYSKKGVEVDQYLRTTNKRVYGVGDCNGWSLFSHSAMHQGMIALGNSISPFKKNFKDFPVPWSIFTSPEYSHVGLTEREARKKYGDRVTVIKKDYNSYGKTVVEHTNTGFIKVVLLEEKILGATIIGEASGEMIGEWVLAIQHNLKISHLLLTQHSFPTYSMMNKMISEDWAMKLVSEKSFIKKTVKFLYSFF